MEGYKLDDFINSNLDEAVEQSNTGLCRDIYKSLSEYIDSDSKEDKALKIIAQICSVHLQDDESNPFVPMYSNRLIHTNDLFVSIADSNLQNILFEYSKQIKQLDLKARIYDILWICKTIKQPNIAAQNAIKAYMEYGIEIISEHPVESVRRIKRSIIIAAELGNAYRNELCSLLTRVVELISKQPDTALYIYSKLLETLVSRVSLLDETKMNECIELCDRATTKAYKDKNMVYYRDLMDVKGEFYGKQGKKEKKQECKLLSARSYAIEANSTESYTIKSNILLRCVEALKKCGANHEEIDKIHKKLLKYQQKVKEEMKAITAGPIDITESVIDAQKAVSKKRVISAIFSFSNICNILSYDKMLQVTKEMLDRNPLYSLSYTMIVNDDGKCVSRVSGDDISDVDPQNSHILVQNYLMYIKLLVESRIEPARQQIICEHCINSDCIKQLLENHPFVPQGREEIFSKGIISGLYGDFIIAAHLLIPQIENSLRHILEQNGGVASYVENGIQEEKGLEALLKEQIIKKIFHKDIIAALDLLLTSRGGPNLRNELAHGLMQSSDFYSIGIVYLWWLVIKLVLLPITFNGSEID